MEGQFQKALQDFDSYRINSRNFIGEIERGSEGVLVQILAQVQTILSSNNENPIKKVLAMRFCKQIMVLGRNDVIRALSKLIPYIKKVCLHRADEQNPDRGETLFNKLPQYIDADEEEKRQIQRYASTYFILTLESIVHWAKWIPVDENGNQSIFSKEYTDLLRKGVKFHSKYHYYKQSDTDRFKNTFKMEFFSQSSFVDESNSQPQSIDGRNSSFYHKRSNLQSLSKMAITVEKIKNTLNELSKENKQHYDKIQIIHGNALTLFYTKFSNETKKLSSKEKQEKYWLEKFCINYSFLSNQLIPYPEFMQKVTSETVNLNLSEQIVINQEVSSHAQMVRGPFSKGKKNQTVSNDKNQKGYYEQIMKTQEKQHQRQLSVYKKSNEQKDRQMMKIHKKYEKQKDQLVKQYQSRINLIKRGLTDTNDEKSEQMIKENQLLKERIAFLQRQLKNEEKRKDQQYDQRKAFKELELLKIQNEKLKAKQISPNNEIYLARIKQLEYELQKEKEQRQCLQKENTNSDFGISEQDITKKQKQIQNLTDELKLFKNQLVNQRSRFQKKQKKYDVRMSQLQSQNKNYKDRISKLQKKLDLRDIQTVQLSKQIQLYKDFDKEVFQENQKNTKISNLANKTPVSRRQDNSKSINFKHNKYEELRNTYKQNKEQLIRFCRCALKKKDLLLKENELQVGLITEVLSRCEMNFIVHFTNMSGTQFQNIQIDISHGNYIESELSTKFIFCIQRQQQEKVIINLRQMTNIVSQTFIPVVLSLNYEKDDKHYTHHLHLPFLNFKLIKFQMITEEDVLLTDRKEELKVNYSKKILPEGKYLLNYFPHIQQTQKNKFQVNCLHRKDNERIRMVFVLGKDQEIKIELIPIDTGKQDDGQILDIISFLEFVFRK